VERDAPQRIRIYGGFNHENPWRGVRDPVYGTVDAWMPGQNAERACLVHLDTTITAEGDVRGDWQAMTGEWVVLQLRYTGQVWERSGTVHVELCADRPPPLAWSERTPGAWVDGQARYELID